MVRVCHAACRGSQRCSLHLLACVHSLAATILATQILRQPTPTSFVALCLYCKLLLCWRQTTGPNKQTCSCAIACPPWPAVYAADSTQHVIRRWDATTGQCAHHAQQQQQQQHPVGEHSSSFALRACTAAPLPPTSLTPSAVATCSSYLPWPHRRLGAAGRSPGCLWLSRRPHQRGALQTTQGAVLSVQQHAGYHRLCQRLHPGHHARARRRRASGSDHPGWGLWRFWLCRRPGRRGAVWRRHAEPGVSAQLLSAGWRPRQRAPQVRLARPAGASCCPCS